MSISLKIKKTQFLGRILCLVLTFTTAISGAASREGTRDGGGGDGIELTFPKPNRPGEVYSKTYLLDLFEYGVHQAPIFNRNVKINSTLLRRVTNALPELDQQISSLVAQKLSEIYAYDKLTAIALLKGIELYTWRLIDANLTDVQDDDGSDVDIDRRNLVQLAIRNSHTIRISKPRFDKLDKENASALVMHEVVYAMLPAKEIKNGSENYVFQESKRAREITGYLYSNYFISKGANGLFALIGTDLPTTKGSINTANNLVIENNTYLFKIRGVKYSFDNGTNKTASIKDIAEFVCKGRRRSPSEQLEFSGYYLYLSFDEYNKSPTHKQVHVRWITHWSERSELVSIPINPEVIASPTCQTEMEVEIEGNLQKIGWQKLDLF
ncbi:MAG: hypothetical protein A4S09_01260 [Proteobacteria bacterium SG_bin7]|nr:MAG: hypothetical protein A4S09_01260 [Proteobacteria bacterium SG_bin7]